MVLWFFCDSEKKNTGGPPVYQHVSNEPSLHPSLSSLDNTFKVASLILNDYGKNKALQQKCLIYAYVHVG